MPKSCVAYNCTNRFNKGSGINFHRFPFSNEERVKQWICAVRRKNFVPTRHSYICSEHFTVDSYWINHPNRKLLKEEAVPSVFNFPKPRKMPETRALPAKCNELDNSVTIHKDSMSLFPYDEDHNYCVIDIYKNQYEEVISKKGKEILKKLLKSMK